MNRNRHDFKRKGKPITPTPPPEGTLPVISNVTLTPTTNSCAVSWDVAPGSTGQIEYADNESFADSLFSNKEFSPLTHHSQTLGSGNPAGAPALSSGTTYWFRIVCEIGGAGGAVGTYTGIFDTSGVPIIPDGDIVVYGAGASCDSRNDYEVGKGSLGGFAVTFRAAATDTVDSLAWPLRTSLSNPAYSLGDGGRPAWSIYPANANGSPNIAAGRIGSRTPGLTGIAPFDDGTTISRVFFPAPKPSLVAGQLYVAVQENLSTAPASNYSAVNRLFLWGADRAPGHTSVLPFDPDHKGWLGNQNPVTGTTSWALDTGQNHCGIDIAFTGGAHSGQAYDNTGLFLFGAGYLAPTIGGARMVRDRIVVSGGDKTITSLYVRVGKQSGTGSLTIALKNSGGTTLRSVVVPASSVNFWNLPDPWTPNGNWVGGSVTSQVLTNGQVYSLELSAPSGTQFSMTGILHTINNDTRSSPKPYADDPDGYGSPAFRDGTMQISTNSGSSWADAYSGTPMVMQALMDLA